VLARPMKKKGGEKRGTTMMGQHLIPARRCRDLGRGQLRGGGRRGRTWGVRPRSTGGAPAGSGPWPAVVGGRHARHGNRGDRGHQHVGPRPL
jgi:hypothetical protein